MTKKKVDTASPHQSIWKQVGFDTFRHNLVALEHATNNLPEDARTNQLEDWLSKRKTDDLDDSARILPLKVEQQVVDDFAFLAAFEVGTNAVSAAVIEEKHNPHELVLRLAANDGINTATKSFFAELLNHLERCARRDISVDACQELAFNSVIKFERKRIRNRLSLRCGQLANVLERNVGSYEAFDGNNRESRSAFIAAIRHLCGLIRSADQTERRSEAEYAAFQALVREVHSFCTANGTRTLRETLLDYNIYYSCIRLNEEILCLDKIARYRGSCIYLAEASERYSSLFNQIRLECEEPYRFLRSPISTEIGSTSRVEGVECLVHAEIQLITYYELYTKHSYLAKNSQGGLLPRCIGSSKAACFLCNLFVREHGSFFLSKIHGRIFDRWIVPDLSSFSKETVQRYRDVLRGMDDEIKRLTKLAKGAPGVFLARQEPLHSWISLGDSLKFQSPRPVSAISAGSSNRRDSSSSEITSGSSSDQLSVLSRVSATDTGRSWSFASEYSEQEQDDDENLQSYLLFRKLKLDGFEDNAKTPKPGLSPIRPASPALLDSDDDGIP